MVSLSGGMVGVLWVGIEKNGSGVVVAEKVGQEGTGEGDAIGVVAAVLGDVGAAECEGDFEDVGNPVLHAVKLAREDVSPSTCECERELRLMEIGRFEIDIPGELTGDGQRQSADAVLGEDFAFFALKEVVPGEYLSQESREVPSIGIVVGLATGRGQTEGGEEGRGERNRTPLLSPRKRGEKSGFVQFGSPTLEESGDRLGGLAVESEDEA